MAWLRSTRVDELFEFGCEVLPRSRRAAGYFQCLVEARAALRAVRPASLNRSRAVRQNLFANAGGAAVSLSQATICKSEATNFDCPNYLYSAPMLIILFNLSLRRVIFGSPVPGYESALAIRKQFFRPCELNGASLTVRLKLSRSAALRRVHHG